MYAEAHQIRREMETEKSVTDDPACANQQLNKKIVNGDAATLLDKAHTRLNGDCMDGKTKTSPVVNGSADTSTGSSDDGSEGHDEAEGRKETNGEARSDEHASMNVGGEADSDDVIRGTTECVVRNNEQVNDGAATGGGTSISVDHDSCSSDSKKSENSNSVMDTTESSNTGLETDANKVNSDVTHVDDIDAVDTSNDELKHTASKDDSQRSVDDDIMSVDDIDNDTGKSVTKLDDSNSSNDVAKLDESGCKDVSKSDDGDSNSRHVTALDDSDINSKDVTNLDDSNSKDITNLDHGDCNSKDVTNLDDGDCNSKDVTNLDDINSKDVTNLDDNNSKDVTSLDDGDCNSNDVTNLDDSDSKDVTSLDDGNSKYDTNLDDGNSNSKDVTMLDDSDGSKDVTNIDDGDSNDVTNLDDVDSKDVTNVDDGDSKDVTNDGDSKDVTNLDDGNSKDVTNLDDSKDVTNLDDSNSKDVTILDDSDGSTKVVTKCDDGDSKDVTNVAECESKGKDATKCSDTTKDKPRGSASDVVTLGDSDGGENPAEPDKTISWRVDGQTEQSGKAGEEKEPVKVVKTKVTANKSHETVNNLKPKVTPSGGNISVKDVTPIRRATSTSVLAPKSSHSSSPSLASKGQLRPMANILFDLGLNLTKEQVYKDLIRIQTRKRSKNKLSNNEILQLNKLKDAHKNLSKKNLRFHFSILSCDRCGFKTDSKTVMAHHDEFAETDEDGDTLCGLCDFKVPRLTENVMPKFLAHMRNAHNRQGRMHTQLLQFTCVLCLFETNIRVVLGRHVKKCERTFKLNRNLEPGPADCDIPMKLPRYGAPTLSETLSRRPVSQATHATVSEHLRKQREDRTAYKQAPAYSAFVQSRPIRPSSSMTSASSMQALLGHTSTSASGAPQQLVQVGGRLYNLVTQNGQTLLTPLASSQLPVVSTGVGRMGVISGAVNAGKFATLGNSPLSSSSVHSIGSDASKSVKAQYSPESPLMQNDKNSVVARASATCRASPSAAPDFEICEICGGFVKDRDSLRIHFYYAHKVEVHRDVFVRTKGQLKCDLCSKRFWTYQGLVKHRQVEHNFKNEDNSRCFLCVRSNITEMLAHLKNNHGITRETLFRRTVCPCCGQHFGSPKLLEKHMLWVHAEIFKQADNPEGQSTPQPGHLNENRPYSGKSNTVPTCLKCNMLFETTAAFLKHCDRLHTFKCSRCLQKWSSLDFLKKHFSTVHGGEREQCPLCIESVVIGRPFIQHMKLNHLKRAAVNISRLSAKKFDFYMEKRRKLSSEDS